MHSRSDQMARTEPFPLIAGMTPSLMRALNAWRLRQTPPQSLEKAMLSLLALALTVEGHLVIEQDNAPSDEDPHVERLAELMRELAHR